MLRIRHVLLLVVVGTLMSAPVGAGIISYKEVQADATGSFWISDKVETTNGTTHIDMGNYADEYKGWVHVSVETGNRVESTSSTFLATSIPSVYTLKFEVKGKEAPGPVESMFLQSELGQPAGAEIIGYSSVSTAFTGRTSHVVLDIQTDPSRPTKAAHTYTRDDATGDFSSVLDMEFVGSPWLTVPFQLSRIDAPIPEPSSLVLLMAILAFGMCFRCWR